MVMVDAQGVVPTATIARMRPTVERANLGTIQQVACVRSAYHTATTVY